MAKVVFPRFQP